MLEKLGFRQLVEEALSVKRKTKATMMYQFVLGMVLACYVGFLRLYHLRFLERELDADRNFSRCPAHLIPTFTASLPPGASLGINTHWFATGATTSFSPKQFSARSSAANSSS